MKELKDSVVLITGGSRGIGRACSLAFAKKGTKIAFTYNKSSEAAVRLDKEIKALGAECRAVALDVRDFKQCCVVIEKTLEDFGHLDVLINNAGIIKDKALMMMAQADWHDVVDTNLGGVFNMSRAAIITFLKQKEGCIINMSSISGIIGLPRQTNYSASKAGIIGFSKALAKEVTAYNIRVNVVCPGYINTSMVEGLRPDLKKILVESIPLKRIGSPDEVANLCVFLASSRSSYITGEVIKIDGGLAI